MLEMRLALTLARVRALAQEHDLRVAVGGRRVGGGRGATAVNRDLGWKRAGRELAGCGGGAFWWILGERASKLTIICPLGIRMRGPAMVVPSETPQSRRSRLRLPDLRAEAVAGIRTVFGSRPSRSGRTTWSSFGAPSLATLAPTAVQPTGPRSRLRARSVERRVIARPTCRPSRDTPARSDRVAGSWITEPAHPRATQKRFPRRRLGRVSVERAIGGGQGDGGSGGSDSTRTNRTR